MEECNGALLRRRYVLNKMPLCFAHQEAGGAVTRREVNASTRLTLTDQLVRFELGGLDYLSLSWELEELGPVHLVLLHQKADKERRALAVLIQDSPQSIDYLVALPACGTSWTSSSSACPSPSPFCTTSSAAWPPAPTT